ncbi:MAG: hypothetical protein RML85_10095, partial [Acidobacteriota bacterium]|nr:hypothetical protein [Acidobacteriota bacterium]
RPAVAPRSKAVYSEKVTSRTGGSPAAFIVMEGIARRADVVVELVQARGQWESLSVVLALSGSLADEIARG